MVDGTEDSSSEGAAAAGAGRRERRGGSRGGDNQLSDELRCPISLEVRLLANHHYYIRLTAYYWLLTPYHSPAHYLLLHG